jgi:hypothetical protein
MTRPTTPALDPATLRWVARRLDMIAKTDAAMIDSGTSEQSRWLLTGESVGFAREAKNLRYCARRVRATRIERKRAR